MPADELTNLTKERGVANEEPSATPSDGSTGNIGRLGRLVLAVVALVLCFSLPLFRLVQFAAESKLYSYILLVPFVSFYLLWLQRPSLRRDSAPVPRLAALPLLAGLGVLVGYWAVVRSGSTLADDDSLALTVSSFVLLLFGACCLFLGKERLRTAAFPLAFLIFMVPLPTFLSNWIEVFLQHGSAAVAYALFSLSGTPVFWSELTFQLPGFSLGVAPECSGIHSSLVLFLTSLLASHLFLRTTWKRAVLTLAVMPLALLRNGLRIFTIGQLCLHIGPEMIHSNIHRRGGPLFFILSLVPFFLLLIVLHKSDRAWKKPEPNPPGA